ncbi:MAG TPA: DUF1326 domain-containing protein [Thermoanaerobaculia bacterium]|nr:DUF1326 domain-containing protein [Thermoanaerobaculia bacterium]
MRARSLLLLLLAALALPVLADEKKTQWKMSGQLEEACSCDAACPCWFGSKPTKMNCSGGFALFIDKGSYGNVPLDGLGAAFMGASKDGTTMMESIGDWNFVTMYIDEKANPEQRKALEAIMRATSPPAAPPERTHIYFVPITRKIEGAEHIVTIGKVGGFSAHLMPGGMGGTSKISNPPGADPIHKEYQQGQTTKQTYTDSGQKWDWSNSNYMFGTFDTNSAEYEKFMAAMSQEMEKAKKK